MEKILVSCYWYVSFLSRRPKKTSTIDEPDTPDVSFKVPPYGEKRRIIFQFTESLKKK